MKKLVKLLITKIFIRQYNKIIDKYEPKIIVVVGSIGKTSTKLAIAKTLSKKYKVQYEDGNYNVPISVPFVLTGQRLPSLTSLTGWIRSYKKGQQILKTGFNYDILVLEYSIDHIGEMDQFKDFRQADIVVVSAIAPEHMENLIDIETVAKEELKATRFSKNILYNGNMVKKEYISKYGDKNANYECYGEQSGADYIQHKNNQNGWFQLKVVNKNNGKIVSATTNMVARHSLDALTVASVIAFKFGVLKSDIDTATQEFNNPSGRMSLLAGKKDSLLLDDSYNSSPEAVIAALQSLYSLKYKKKIAILGNMNELGKYSKKAHQQIGEYCHPNKLDLLITIGSDANKYISAIAKKNGCKVITTNSPVVAGRIALEHLEPKSAILIKGSQNNVFSEESIKPLLLNPQDVTKLVRQSDYWLNIKRQQFSEIS